MLDPLAPGLWDVMSHCVVPGTEPKSSGRAARALNHLNHLPSPSVRHLFSGSSCVPGPVLGPVNSMEHSLAIISVPGSTW